MNRNHNIMEKKSSQIPSWLWTTSSLLPPVYKQVWAGVRDDRSGILTASSAQIETLVDTNKVFPLLLTSQLPTEVLGYIWSLANHKYAGQLTEQELYIVLALVAIAQASYTFNNLDILHLMPSPPIPNLNLSLLNMKEQFPTRSETKYQPVTSLSDTNDEFSEFQSAPAPNVSNIHMLDTKQGSAIGSRLANHNLGVRKPADKSKKTNANKYNQVRNSGSNTNLSLHSKDLLSSDRLTELFPKCNLQKTQSKVVILKDTAIRSNDPAKDMSVNNKEHIDSLDKPQVLDKDTSNPHETLKATSKKQMERVQKDLMSVQPVEDKYSALRVLVDDPPPFESETNLSLNDSPADDFGDFVSAEQPVSPSNLVPARCSTDFSSSFDSKESNINFAPKNTLLSNLSDSFSNLRCESMVESFGIGEKFHITSDIDVIFVSEKVTQKDDNISVNSIELMGNGSGSGGLTRSGSVPSLDLKCFLTNSQDDEHQTENMHQLIYWEWKQYMESCVLLLQIAANIFTSISSEEVLHEVLSSAQGYDFLCNLAEVAAVCRRVNFSHKEMDINIMGFDDLLLDIDKIWAEMEPFYSNIPIVTELPVWPLHQGHLTDSGDIEREGIKHLTDYKFKLQKAEQDMSTLQATFAGIESRMIRYKSAVEASEKAGDELKVKKRNQPQEIQELVREAEELKTECSRLERKIDGLKNTNAALLKEVVRLSPVGSKL